MGEVRERQTCSTLGEAGTGGLNAVWMADTQSSASDVVEKSSLNVRVGSSIYVGGSAQGACGASHTSMPATYSPTAFEMLRLTDIIWLMLISPSGVGFG